MPKVPIDRGAKNGRTVGWLASSDLHFTTVGGHTGLGQGAGGGHLVGAGQFTTGHLGLGQGGHSPILQGLEQPAMQGGHLGTDDFRTYLDISGRGGHSVFNMYLERSGIGGQGGMVARRTHFPGSGEELEGAAE